MQIENESKFDINMHSCIKKREYYQLGTQLAHQGRILIGSESHGSNFS